MIVSFRQWLRLLEESNVARECEADRARQNTKHQHSKTQALYWGLAPQEFPFTGGLSRDTCLIKCVSEQGAEGRRVSIFKVGPETAVRNTGKLEVGPPGERAYPSAPAQ